MLHPFAVCETAVMPGVWFRVAFEAVIRHRDANMYLFLQRARLLHLRDSITCKFLISATTVESFSSLQIEIGLQLCFSLKTRVLHWFSFVEAT